MKLQSDSMVSADEQQSARIEQYVEMLCNQGCRQVTVIIAALRAGEAVPGLESLDEVELARVLAELEAIMSVYENGCPHP